MLKVRKTQVKGVATPPRTHDPLGRGQVVCCGVEARTSIGMRGPGCSRGKTEHEALGRACVCLLDCNGLTLINRVGALGPYRNLKDSAYIQPLWSRTGFPWLAARHRA